MITKNFNLALTIESGQFFQYKKFNGAYLVWSGDKLFKISQRANQLRFRGVDEDFIRHFFSLDIPYEKIIRQISKDRHVAAAINKYPGLRIMRQDFYECLIAYICSANANIPKITKNVHLISEFFGRPVRFNGATHFLFPKPGKLCVHEKLLQAKTGFRAKYICKVNYIVEAEFISRIKSMEYEQARQMLIELPGVGPKVADCVLLFSLDKLEAFPVDVWIRRIMERFYGKSGAEVHKFARARFGEYAGYANQFLFSYIREISTFK